MDRSESCVRLLVSSVSFLSVGSGVDPEKRAGAGICRQASDNPALRRTSFCSAGLS
jgi:hypothetical protein